MFRVWLDQKPAFKLGSRPSYSWLIQVKLASGSRKIVWFAHRTCVVRSFRILLKGVRDQRV